MVTAAAGRGEAHPSRGSRQTMSIGAVLGLLRPEFPDVSISKIRFLEDQGLVEPARTPSGYRKFGLDDVERLRFVLGAQRDHYLPLRVIRDQLEAIDRGLDTPTDQARATRGTGVSAASGPRLVESPDREPSHDRSATGEQRLTRAQLLAAAGADDSVLLALESHGLVAARPGGVYDGDALLVVGTAVELAEFGIEPRHLRAFRAAADREAGLIEQVVSPLRRQRSPEAAARAQEATRELSRLCVRLHASLVRTAIERGGS